MTLEPFGYEAIRAANRPTFGRDAMPVLTRFEDAEVVLSFGADFAGDVAVQRASHARGFAPHAQPSATARPGRSSTSSRGSR